MRKVCGAPCWASLLTHDAEAARRFYGSVLDWEFRPGASGPEFQVAEENGFPVAGFGELAGPWQMPASWTVYFQVEDADLAAARIRERGATMAVGPLQVGDGRAGRAADPGGAAFGMWEGDRADHWPPGDTRAPWLELRTRDAFAAALFYGEIFDWAGEDGRSETVYEYEEDEVLVRAGGRYVAGLRGGGVENAPDPRVRTRWQIHFRVPDVERAVEAAEEAGGGVVSPPQHTHLGLSAALRDPEGALFAVMAA